MAREFSRTRRVGEQMQRELAELVQREVKDPRVGFVTISGVQVSRDLSHAKVFFSLLDDAHSVAETREGLRRAAGFLRRELAQRMVLRSVPELHFEYDASVEQGNRLSALIDRAVAEDKKHSDEEDPNQ